MDDDDSSPLTQNNTNERRDHKRMLSTNDERTNETTRIPIQGSFFGRPNHLTIARCYDDSTSFSTYTISSRMRLVLIPHILFDCATAFRPCAQETEVERRGRMEELCTLLLCLSLRTCLVQPTLSVLHASMLRVPFVRITV